MWRTLSGVKWDQPNCIDSGLEERTWTGSAFLGSGHREVADGAGKDCSLEFLSTAPKKMIVNPDGQRDKSVKVGRFITGRQFILNGFI